MATDTKWVGRRRRITLLGDSLTELGFSTGGWAARLADHYSRKADVINRGFVGYNSRWALHVLDGVLRDCSQMGTELVTVFFGANDAAVPLPDGHPLYAHQHVPLVEYKDNIRHIVKAIRGYGMNNIILITPPPVYELGINPESEAGWGRSTAFAQQYAVACHELGSELCLPVVDLWNSMQAVESWGDKLFSDGLHFTANGNEHVFVALLDAINTAYPSLRAESLPLHYPAWYAIDSGDPASSFVPAGSQQE